jgi:hypothetical protein
MNRVGACVRKPTLTQKNIQLNVPYLIESMRFIDTKYGKRVLVEFLDSNHFLPARFVDLNEETIKQFRPREYEMLLKRDEFDELIYVFESRKVNKN